MVLDYLVHYGYCDTAQVFATATGQQVEEEVASIRNRQSKAIIVTVCCEQYNSKLTNALIIFIVICC